MQQQLPQIAHFTRRHPDARKLSFHQQLQNVCRVPLVRLLLPHIAGPNLRRIAHPQLVSQLTEQIHQPMAVARRLHPDQRRRRYLPIEPFRISRGLHQLLLPSFSCLRIQPTHLLPAGMKITSYNHHVRRLLSFREALVLKPRLPDSIEPSLLSNQLHLRTGRIFLFVTAPLLRPATTAHVGPDALVRAGEPCSPTSCDAPHRWAGEGTRPYVTCPDDPLPSATTTDILLQF